ncbi:MAG: ArsR family transcriptional regulator [Anaerolinea sp.]|nr:ArsR family transcriptional regulator [Anaerolinea sp.]
MATNITTYDEIAHLLQIIGQAARLQILLAIGEGETCVCHLEAALGWRQAYISQHLMALREAGIVTDRRDGRYIHYRLRNVALLDLVRQAARLQGVTEAETAALAARPGHECPCPKCNSEKEGCHEKSPEYCAG